METATDQQVYTNGRTHLTVGPSNPGAYHRLLAILFTPRQSTEHLHTSGAQTPRPVPATA